MPGYKRNKRVKMYKAGGSLKDVPAGNKGLGNLPASVRNKMGYKKRGGSIDGKYEQYD